MYFCLEKIFIRFLLKKNVLQNISQALLYQHVIFGNPKRVRIAQSATVNNALFNVMSGRIVIGETVFFGHNVCLITGTHDYKKTSIDRKKAVPSEGRDIVVKDGAWIASNVTVLGPAIIGEHAVVAAGAIVIGDVAPYTIVAGVPAKAIRKIEILSEK